MATRRDKTKKSTKPKQTAETRARARLNASPQARQLLALFNLPLLDETLESDLIPRFGGEVTFTLTYYNDKHEQVTLPATPTFTRMAHHLGFISSVDYEAVKQNSTLPERLQQMLYSAVVERGKKEMRRILRDARPLLLRGGIYLYCLPLHCISTSEESGEIIRDPGDRPLVALPISVAIAKKFSYTDDQIRALAPQNAWLLPMLVVYRVLKNTQALRDALDGWLKLLSPQEHENLYIKFNKYAPGLIDEKILALLHPKSSVQPDEHSSV